MLHHAPSATSVPPLPATLDFDVPHRFVDVGHSRLAYWRVGRGPDVLFIHGWPLHAATFRRTVAALADRFTCHLFDLPGCGKTEWSARSPIELGAHARTVRALVDALQLSRYGVVAHDSGGFIARELAADDARAAGLVLGNTEVPGHTPLQLVLIGLIGKAGLGRPAMRLLLGSRTLRRSWLAFGHCFTDRDYVDGEFAQLFLEPLLRSPRALDGQARLVDTWSNADMARLPGLHARIRVPVALVWGDADPWFPLARARAMCSQLGGPVVLTEIAGGKLFVHEDRASEFAAAARAHLLRCLA